MNIQEKIDSNYRKDALLLAIKSGGDAEEIMEKAERFFQYLRTFKIEIYPEREISPECLNSDFSGYLSMVEKFRRMYAGKPLGGKS